MADRVFSHEVGATTAEQWRADARWQRAERCTADRLLGAVTRLVVVAAHPDDETLGAGALTLLAHERGLRTDVVLITAGEHSHPDSPTVTPAGLGARRLAEARAALAALDPDARLACLGIADGAVADAEVEVATRLVALVGDGRHTLLVAPWRHDGHPDHEAAGRAAAVVAARTGARLLEYPIWTWQWGRPDDAPWQDLLLVPVDEAVRARTRVAVAAHASQVRPLSQRPGDETLLSTDFLAHFEGAEEVYVVQPAVDATLDTLHREQPDPWGVDERWYERRKRAVTLAALPRQHLGRALEVGCSTGALAADLAARCDEVLAIDASAAAVASARRRLAGAPNVEVARVAVPGDWPEGTFDLVVVSEVAYFLSPRDIERLGARIRDCLAPDGVVVSCHWRHEVDGWVLSGAAAHGLLTAALELVAIVCHRERDFALDVHAASRAALPRPSA